MNSKAYPGTQALVAGQGERVRIRFGNLSAMEHHPIHLHGHTFHISQTDGGTIPAGSRFPANTVLVPVGSTRAIDFVAENLGDWPMHCHMTHHTMNQMGHRYPNLMGVQPTKEEIAKLRKAFPGYMLMGQNGMEEMMEMSMGSPRNSIAMEGNPDGPFGLIDMGGMFTLLKIRGKVGGDYGDPGWYEHPKGTVAVAATAEDLRANGIKSLSE
jgi:manganese oxidase